MKIKTNKLTGTALDWAVAKCEGATDFWFDTVATHWVKLHGQDRALRYGWAQSYLPSTNWSQGGPIIERQKIGLREPHETPDVWYGRITTDVTVFMKAGPTPPDRIHALLRSVQDGR